MQRYILIRLVQAIFVLFFVSIIVFGMARASGNPVDLMLPIDATPQDHERLTAFWGLDKPLHIQYGKFLGNALQGDFGQSIKWTGKSAMGMVLSRIPASIHLAGTAMVFAVVLALVLGVASAREERFVYGRCRQGLWPHRTVGSGLLDRHNADLDFCRGSWVVSNIRSRRS